MQIVKRLLILSFPGHTAAAVLAALFWFIAPALVEGQADKIAAIQSRLQKARSDEAAANAKWQEEHEAFQKAQAQYDKDYAAYEKAKKQVPPPPGLKPPGKPVQAYEKKAAAELEEAKKKRIALEAELKAAQAQAAAAQATPVATPTAVDKDQVTVPDLSVFDNVSEMKAILAHAGLTGAFSAQGKPPSKEMEFKFAGQSPPANTKVKRGSTVTVSIYQKFEDPSADEVVVPDLSVFANVSEMKTALGHVGLTGAFSAQAKPPSKEKEFKLASQSPAPNTRVKKGSTVTVTIYQKFADSSDTVPNLIGKTLEQAGPLLEPLQLSIGGLDDTQKTDKPELVNTIFEQNPAAGAALPENKTVSVRRYGGLKTKDKEAKDDPLDQIIAGPEKELIGNFSGTAQMTTFDIGDTKHVRPIVKAQPMTVGIWRDDQGKWHFSGRIEPNSGIGESGAGGTTTVTGGTLTFEQHSKNVDRVCTIKVSGNELTGVCQNTMKDGNLQPPPITFKATRK